MKKKQRVYWMIQSTQTQRNAEIQVMMLCHFVGGGIMFHKLISLGLLLFGKNKARLLPYYLVKIPA